MKANETVAAAAVQDPAPAAVPQIFRAIPAIMADMSAVGKTKETQDRRFRYRGIDDVMNAMWPLLSKHRVFVVPEVLDQTREERSTGKTTLLYSILRVRFSFYASDGSSVQAVTIGEGMDAGDKASNKAMAVALKYALFQTFCIPTEEMAGDDPDHQVHEVRPRNSGASQRQAAVNRAEQYPPQNYAGQQANGQNGAYNAPQLVNTQHVAALRTKAYNKNISLLSLLNSYGVISLEDLTMQQWHDAMDKLEKYPDREVRA